MAVKELSSPLKRVTRHAEKAVPTAEAKAELSGVSPNFPGDVRRPSPNTTSRGHGVILKKE